MQVKVVRSPNRKKKFRAILEDGRTVDFGARGYSDYTKHKTPSRMRSYVLRHGGRIPKRSNSCLEGLVEKVMIQLFIYKLMILKIKFYAHYPKLTLMNFTKRN